ncbi:unnamed protein product [Menidia menidia]|uniref:(Atlantic silverside) hypothetical protein n=1 Tax=Menidia menidia TaxID=238744 RepID=A0A8S4AZF6_9TELE|nr:unnamed protein product [Menidia menidia]
METHGRDFLNTPPMKIVRFGGSVADTLEKHRQGLSSDYELLRHQLADPDIKDAQIINWLQEFRNCVSQLTKDHEQLIYTILRLPWVGRSQAVVEEYMAFLGNLVSAQTVYLCACLKMVVSHFTPKRITICEGGVDFSDSDDEDDLPRNFDQCHQALQLILRYVPSTSRFLMPILQENFPFVQKSSRTLECYVHNLLRVTVYIPSIRKDVLEVIIGKMLKLDVSASRADIEEAEENAGQSQAAADGPEEGLFHMDEDVLGDPPPGSDAMAHPVAERLDALMDVLMAYIRDICHTNGEPIIQPHPQPCIFIQDLLSVFDKLILPTHASSHVQYTLFYLCSFRLALAEAFLDHLWKVLQNPSQPAVLRQAAAGYLGSFLARANFLPLLTVRACLDLLVSWIHGYIDRQDGGGGGRGGRGGAGRRAATPACTGPSTPPARPSSTRWCLEYMQSLNLERIVMCQLNPLKVKYQVVFCYTIIERNSRTLLPVVRSSAGGDGVATNTNPLDSFFPFDPYLLKKSGRRVQPLYQVWEELADIELPPTRTEPQASKEEEDDFLCGVTPQNEGVLGLTPSPYGSSICSPPGLGSPPIARPPPF